MRQEECGLWNGPQTKSGSTTVPDLPRTCGLAERKRAAWSTRTVVATIHRSLRAVALTIAFELRIRRDTRRLLEAEPHILRDLGIVRADVERLVRYGRDQRG